jgi:hypothetical protein
MSKEQRVENSKKSTREVRAFKFNNHKETGV